MYLFLFLLFYKIGAKFYFLIPMYSVLLSVGSIILDDKLAHSFKMRLSVPIIYVLFSLPLLPMLVPMLPVNDYIEYAKILGVDAGVKYESNRLNGLPQHFADRFGWEELVAEISKVYHSVPPEKRVDTGIMTSNWGIASAVHFFKEKYNLPEPICNSGWFYFEINRNKQTATDYVCVGYFELTLHKLFNTVTKKSLFVNSYCMPHENNRPIYLCTNPKLDPIAYFKVERHIDRSFLSILRNEGASKAIEYFRKEKGKNSKTILFTENQVNRFGYEYLGKNLIEEAILLFKFNVEVNPESFNVYDSLGEAYMKAGKYMLAVSNYKKSLDLNSKNINAEKKLEELYMKIGKRI